MRGYVLRGCISVLALWLVAVLVPDVRVDGIGAWLGCALTIGLINGLSRTVIVFYVLPLSVLLIGPLVLALNGALLAVLTLVFEGVEFVGLAAALLGWIVLAAVAFLATWYIGPEGRFQSLVATRSRHLSR